MEHPITPPPELVQQWREQMPAGIFDGYKYPEREKALCLVAARWGADQELEACCEYMQHEDFHGFATELRTARRPKPPSLKEQAQTELDRLIALIPTEGAMAMAEPIRKALEALPND